MRGYRFVSEEGSVEYGTDANASKRDERANTGCGRSCRAVYTVSTVPSGVCNDTGREKIYNWRD